MSEHSDLVGRLAPSWKADEAASYAVSILRSDERTGVAEDLNREIVANNALKAEAADAIQSLIARAESAEATAARLTEALSGLVTRLDLVHADPAYRAVWELAQLHSAPYRGPGYTKELERARTALASTSGGGNG